MPETAILNDILILCEQFEGILPGQRKPEYYINPILKWMTAEWKVIKKLIAKAVMDVALGRTPKLEAKRGVICAEGVPTETVGIAPRATSNAVLESHASAKPTAVRSTDASSETFRASADIFFPEGKQNLIFQLIESLIGKMSVEVKEQVQEAKKKARSDARPKLARGTVNIVTTVLSREGLEAVIAGLDFQKDFVDDLNLSTKQRIGRLLESRYGTATDLRTQVDHALRISRDNVLDVFHDDVAKIAKKMRDGTITSEKFTDDMMSSIRKEYRKIYREGKGSPLEGWEEDFIKQQAETQRQYLGNFKGYIDRKEIIGEELTSYVDNRAGLYAERGTALYEAGWVSNLPDDVLLNWVLGVAEHCPTCPTYAANSPYTKSSLPGFPGEGFNLTVCGTNCKCFLEVSDLYASGGTEIPAEGFDEKTSITPRFEEE